MKTSDKKVNCNVADAGKELDVSTTDRRKARGKWVAVDKISKIVEVTT